MNITKLKKEIYQTNKENGFWDEERNTGEMLMLIVSELAEALEADREDKYAKLELFELEQQDAQSQEQWKVVFENNIKDTFEDEIADTIIRLLDISEGLNIPIEKHIGYKLEYNTLRQRKHGKKY